MNNKTKEKSSIYFWLVKKITNKCMRRKIKWKHFKEKYFQIEKTPLEIDKQKIIDLFTTLIKDKKSTLNYSLGSNSRFIESEFLWACLSPYNNTRDCIITIVDESIPNNPHSHEIIIPSDYSNDIKYAFDLESERRFKSLELEKKKVVVNDLDKLIIKVKENG
jgi:hypothetical protein